MAPVDPKLRAVLVCPRCRGELTDVPDGLWCPADALLYPVVDDVPHMVPELAKPYRGPVEPAG